MKRVYGKLQTEEGKKVYGKRRQIIEPVFRQGKSNLGFMRFLPRGLEKASGEGALMCLVHSIRRSYAYLKTKRKGLTGRLVMVYILFPCEPLAKVILNGVKNPG